MITPDAVGGLLVVAVFGSVFWGVAGLLVPPGLYPLGWALNSKLEDLACDHP